jgi:hypothetical protein
MNNNDESIYFDRRLMVAFSSLGNYRDEVKIINHLIEFIYHYYLITGINKNPESSKVFQYYSQNIMKPSSIEKMIMNMSTQIDAIDYISKYYNQVILIKSGMDTDHTALIIDYKACYDRQHYLNVMKYLLSRNNDISEVKCIIEYLNKKDLKEHNIPDDYVKRIISKMYNIT